MGRMSDSFRSRADPSLKSIVMPSVEELFCIFPLPLGRGL